MEHKDDTIGNSITSPTSQTGIASPMTSATVQWQKHKHSAEKPVIIAGLPVYLGAFRDISSDTTEMMDLVCPLNGAAPWARFGRLVPTISCDLQDRGGVPPQWEAFIKAIARSMKNGRKILAYCVGSHGRTGTFGASLIAVMEPNTEDPIAEIRKRHCEEAVESLEQAKAIFALKGKPLPKRYVNEFTKHLKWHENLPLDWEAYFDGYGNNNNTTTGDKTSASQTTTSNETKK